MEIDAKEILYAALEEIGKEKVESSIVSVTSEVSTVINQIWSKCVQSLNSYKDYDRAKVHGDLAESLMHYLLTITMIPSERKVKHNNIEIDIVIPTVKQLQTDPKRTLVIAFQKSLATNDVDAHIQKLVKAQPNRDNIWLVFGYHDNVIDSYTEFVAFLPDDSKGQFKPLSSIIDEIRQFVETNKIKSFRIFRT